MFRFLNNAAPVQYFRGNFIVRCEIPVERFETYFNPVFLENIREAAFWQAAMKGHLAALESGLRRIAGTGFLAFFSAACNDDSYASEVNVVTCDPDLARRARLRLWSEHLERDAGEIGGNPAAVVDALWRPIAREQREREQSGAPRTHRLLELPGVSRRAKRLLGPLDSLVVDA